MIYSEFLILAKAMKSVYTRDNFLPDEDSIKIWFQMLQDLDYKLASASIQKWMLTNKFPPTIAEIREGASGIELGDPLDWGEAWATVIRAVKMYGWYRQAEAMDSLDELTRECVKQIGGFSVICDSENIAVERANFRMAYETMERRKRENNQIPAKLLNTIAQIRENHQLQLAQTAAAQIATKEQR